MKLIRSRYLLQRGEARLPSILLLLLMLVISWLLWSGLYKPLVMGLGAFSCVLSTYLAYRMGFFRRRVSFKLFIRLPSYWLWLLREIVVSSLEVAKLIMKPSLPICPSVVLLKSEAQTDVGQVIFGNSIILSPGTVTLDATEGQLLVHCLTAEGARQLQNGEINRRVAALECN